VTTVEYAAALMRLPLSTGNPKALWRCLTLLVATLISLALTPELAAAQGPSSNPAQQDLAHSLAAAKEAGTVRITVRFYAGSTTGKVVQDSSLNAGEQTVAIGKEFASVILVRDGSAYISGNTAGLKSFFGLPSAMLPGLLGRWALVEQSDSVYPDVTANVSLQSALPNVTPSGMIDEGKRSRVNGQWVKSIEGSLPGGGGHLVLFVSANKRSLPVEAVESSGTNTSGRGEIVTFSRWGEHVDLPRPSHVVPFSTLQALASQS